MLCVYRYGHAAHRHAAEYHAAAAAQAHHSMAAAAGYGGLLLGRGSLHHQYKPVPVEWSAQHHAPHHLDPAGCTPYSYPPVPAGQYLSPCLTTLHYTASHHTTLHYTTRDTPRCGARSEPAINNWFRSLMISR